MFVHLSIHRDSHVNVWEHMLGAVCLLGVMMHGLLPVVCNLLSTSNPKCSKMTLGMDCFTFSKVCVLWHDHNNWAISHRLNWRCSLCKLEDCYFVTGNTSNIHKTIPYMLKDMHILTKETTIGSTINKSTMCQFSIWVLTDVVVYGSTNGMACCSVHCNLILMSTIWSIATVCAGT